MGGLVGPIAKRFLFDRKGSDDPLAHGFVSFIASISIAGLALGVTALLVVTSVMNGFEKELKNSLTAFHGHVLLFSRGEPVNHPERYVQEIKTSIAGITAVSPYIFTEVMLSSAKGVAGSVVEGVDLPSFPLVSRVPEKIISGRLPIAQSHVSSDEIPEITLGVEVARKLRVAVGDTIVLTVPFALKDSQPLVKKIKVVGLMKLGMFDYDSKYSLLEISDLQKILGLENKVNAFKILTQDPNASLKITAALNDRYVYPLRARDWSSLNQNIFYAIRLEKVVIGIILMVIILVASFNIISTLIMMVHEKQRQVAMLKALGFRPIHTFGLFLIIGGGMSICGTILGLGFGRALCAVLQWKSIIDLPADIYLLSRLPVEIRWWEWALICILTMVLALLSTLWPSYRIAKEAPAKGLRNE